MSMKTSIDKFREKQQARGSDSLLQQPGALRHSHREQPARTEQASSIEQPPHPEHLPEEPTLREPRNWGKVDEIFEWTKRHPKLALVLALSVLSSLPLSLIPVGIFLLWFFNKR